MGIKTIQLGREATGPWFALAGNSGDLSTSMGSIENTIYGSEYESSMAGIGEWSFSGNSWLSRSIAGYNASVKRVGTPVPFTDETLVLVSGTTYEVQTPSKAIWQPDTDIIVKDGGVAVDPEEILSIDALFGRITFVSTFVPVGTLTVDATAITSATFACANEVSLTQSTNIVDIGCFDTVAEEDGFTVNDYGLKTVSIDLSGFYRASDDFFTILKGRGDLILDIDFTGDGQVVARAIVRMNNQDLSGDPGNPEEFSASFELSVPDNKVLPYNFQIAAASEVPEATRIVLEKWFAREKVYLRYFPNGVEEIGFQGATIVGDASISVSLDGASEMTVDLTGTGELEKIND